VTSLAAIGTAAAAAGQLRAQEQSR
jgi:hypothetical protein